MNPIKSFSITGMSLSGFKCFADKAEIPFFPVTQVTGGNGRGKSSVADAIAFSVTGLPFFGERGVDRLHSERNPDLSVTLRFTDENGDAHELIRNRQKSRCSLLYDGREIRQSDLSVMFGEKTCSFPFSTRSTSSRSWATTERNFWNAISRTFRRKM